MSIYKLLRSRMFLSAGTRVEKVADVMSRNRWEEFEANINFNNNDHMIVQNDPNRDKLFKVRPLVDSLQAKFKGIPNEDSMVCVDNRQYPSKVLLR